MKQPIKTEHWFDKDGNPTGGISQATGILVSWQNGPLGRDENRKEPNGAFTETLIAIAIDKLEFYQKTKFKSDFNARAIYHLELALQSLQDRTADREARQVEGEYKL